MHDKEHLISTFFFFATKGLVLKLVLKILIVDSIDIFSFAESIVNCVRGPLSDNCPEDVTKGIAGAMYRFLPPFCMTDNFITVTQMPVAPTTIETEDTDTQTTSASSTGKLLKHFKPQRNRGEVMLIDFHCLSAIKNLVE